MLPRVRAADDGGRVARGVGHGERVHDALRGRGHGLHAHGDDLARRRLRHRRRRSARLVDHEAQEVQSEIEAGTDYEIEFSK